MKKETIIKNSKLRGGRPPTVHKDKKKYDRKRDKKIKPNDIRPVSSSTVEHATVTRSTWRQHPSGGPNTITVLYKEKNYI